MIKQLVVSAPFGNYHRLLRRLTAADFTPTLGTFTWERRGFWTKPYGGPITRLLLSVRYSPLFRSWRNKIGLKNPGINWLLNHTETLDNKGSRVPGIYAHDKIVSIYGWTEAEWYNLISACRDIMPLAIEINASCPNVHKPPFTSDIFKTAVNSGLRTIVKLPPIGFQKIAEMAYGSGIRTFHATNTLPTPRGGISGKILLPIALEAVRQLRERYHDVTIIGGGGITSEIDAISFVERGADHVAIGSMLFNPLNWSKVEKIASTILTLTNLKDALKPPHQ